MSPTILLPALLVGCVWLTFMIIAFAFMVAYHCSGSWTKKYDKCTQFDVKYKYIIRLNFGLAKKNFDITNTDIKVEVLGPNDVLLSKFSITRELLNKCEPMEGQKNQFVTKFLLYRSTSIGPITYVTVNHNKSGSILVYSLEIQDITEPKAHIAYINCYVESLDKNKLFKQKFPAAGQIDKLVEPLGASNQVINSEEMIAFVWLTVNTIIVLCNYLIICNTTTDGSKTSLHICKTFRNQYLSSALTAVAVSVVALIIFMVTFVFYKLFIKPFVESVTICAIFRIIYMFLVIITGAMMGIIGGSHVIIYWDKFDENNIRYWSLSAVLAFVIFVAIYLPIITIVVYLLELLFCDRSDSKEALPKSSAVKTDKEDDTGADTYHQQLAGQTKIKSISQYAGPTQKKTDPKVVPKVVPKVDTKVDTKADTKPIEVPEEEEGGEGYYKQLMKDKEKIKSISNY